MLIDAPVDTVYDDVLDIGTFWTGAPDVAAGSVRRTPDGVGTLARIYTHWLGAHMEGGIEIVQAVRPERVVAQVTFVPESPMWTFTLEPVDGGTRLGAARGAAPRHGVSFWGTDEVPGSEDPGPSPLTPHVQERCR